MGNDFLNTVQGIMDAYQSNMTQAAATDSGTASITKLFSIQIENALKGLNPDQIQQAATLLNTLGGSITGIAGLGGIVDAALSAANDAVAQAAATAAATKQATIDQNNQSVMSSILQYTDPKGAANYNEQVKYQQALTQAEKDGSSVLLVYYQHQLALNAAQQQGVQTTIQAAQSLVTLYQGMVDSIESAKASLLSNTTLSPLSGLDQRNQAMDALQAALTTVQTGTDADAQKAVQQLPGLSQQALTASKAYYASSEQYYQDFQTVQGILDQSEQYARSHLDAATQQLDVAQQQLAVLQQQAQSLVQIAQEKAQDPLVAAVQKIISDRSTDITLNGGVDAAGSTFNRQQAQTPLTHGQWQALNNLGGYSGLIGAGGANAFYAANPAAMTQFNNVLQMAREMLLAEGITPGFAAGGAFDGGNVVQIPTLFAMRGGQGLMGEAGPEAIMPLGRTSSGRLGVHVSAGSSTDGLEGKLDRLIALMEGLIQINAMNGDNAVAVQSQVVNGLAEVSRRLRRAA